MLTKDDPPREKNQIPGEYAFEKCLDEAQKWAASVGLTRDDVDAAVNAVRSRKRPEII